MFPQTVNNAQISWQILSPKVVGTTHSFCDLVNNSDEVNKLILQFVKFQSLMHLKGMKKINIC